MEACARARDSAHAQLFANAACGSDSCLPHESRDVTWVTRVERADDPPDGNEQIRRDALHPPPHSQLTDGGVLGKNINGESLETKFSLDTRRNRFPTFRFFFPSAQIPRLDTAPPPREWGEGDYE